MFTKDKVLLLVSAITLFATLIAALGTFPEILLLGIRFQIIWLPIWIVIVFLPFLNIIEIAKKVDEYSIYNWIALLLNVITIFFIMRSFKLDFF